MPPSFRWTYLYLYARRPSISAAWPFSLRLATPPPLHALNRCGLALRDEPLMLLPPLKPFPPGPESRRGRSDHERGHLRLIKIRPGHKLRDDPGQPPGRNGEHRSEQGNPAPQPRSLRPHLVRALAILRRDVLKSTLNHSNHTSRRWERPVTGRHPPTNLNAQECRATQPPAPRTPNTGSARGHVDASLLDGERCVRCAPRRAPMARPIPPLTRVSAQLLKAPDERGERLTGESQMAAIGILAVPHLNYARKARPPHIRRPGRCPSCSCAIRGAFPPSLALVYLRCKRCPSRGTRPTSSWMHTRAHRPALRRGVTGCTATPTRAMSAALTPYRWPPPPTPSPRSASRRQPSAPRAEHEMTVLFMPAPARPLGRDGCAGRSRGGLGVPHDLRGESGVGDAGGGLAPPVTRSAGSDGDDPSAPDPQRFLRPEVDVQRRQPTPPRRMPCRRVSTVSLDTAIRVGDYALIQLSVSLYQESRSPCSASPLRSTPVSPPACSG